MKKIISIIAMSLLLGTAAFADTVWFWIGTQCIRVDNAYRSGALIEPRREGEYNEYSGNLTIVINGKRYITSMYTIEED